MSESLLMVLAAISLACVVTTIGVLAISRFGSWTCQRSVYFTGFTAKVLISVSFTHIIPKSLEVNARTSTFFLLDFLGI